MAIKRVVYMVVTDDYDLAAKMKQFVESLDRAWTFITKYYDESSKGPVKTTSEAARGA